MQFKSEFLIESQARGFIYQGNDLEALDARLCAGPVTAYIGFDATATSFHVGNLVQIMRLRLLQRTGHNPIILMGDGTTRIGDPSGKDSQRQLLSAQQIDHNVQSLQKIFCQFIDFEDNNNKAILLRNYDWLQELNYLEFLRDYGRYFSVNRMLSFDSVKTRLDRNQPLSFLEFNYMILQAYDFLHLSRAHDCILQLGGSDQWGNILNGAELIRRVDGKDAFALTVELITTADGKKMGKTAQGAVWLNADLLSVLDYWQFWRNCQDTDTARFLKIFTDLPLSEIAQLEKLQGAELNDAKIILADAATRLCHGDDALQQVKATVNKLFTADSTDLTQMLSTLPTMSVARADIITGVLLIDALMVTKLAASKSESRRLIRSQAVKINDQSVQDEMRLIVSSDIVTAHSCIKLSVSKKRHALIKIVD